MSKEWKKKNCKKHSHVKSPLRTAPGLVFTYLDIGENKIEHNLCKHINLFTPIWVLTGLSLPASALLNLTLLPKESKPKKALSSLPTFDKLAPNSWLLTERSSSSSKSRSWMRNSCFISSECCRSRSSAMTSSWKFQYLTHTVVDKGIQMNLPFHLNSYPSLNYMVYLF